MNKLPVKILEKTFNRYLSLDSHREKSLAPLIGRCLGLHIARPKVSLFFTFNAEGVTLSSEAPEKIDTEIYASLFQLMRLKFTDPSSLLNTQLYIKGDVDTAQAFNTLLQQHHIDWEEHLSGLIGDIGAHKMLSLLKKPKEFLKRNTEKLKLDISEYCQEEARILPSTNEVMLFKKEVNDLRLSIEKYQIKINALSHPHD